MFVKAIEGETNATVVDRAFTRRADPPSIYQQAKMRGIPAIPVASINRPQIFTNLRAANPNAASDLRGQEGLTLAMGKLAANQGKIIARERGVAVKRESAILSTAIKTIERNRERQGLGYDQPLLTTGPEPVYGTTPLDPVAVAQKVATGQKLSQQEFAVWEAQSPLARGVWTILPQVQAGTSTIGILAQIQSWLTGETIPGVKNLYLAGGMLGLAAFTAFKRRR